MEKLLLIRLYVHVFVIYCFSDLLEKIIEIQVKFLNIWFFKEFLLKLLLVESVSVLYFSLFKIYVWYYQQFNQYFQILMYNKTFWNKHIDKPETNIYFSTFITWFLSAKCNEGKINKNSSNSSIIYQPPFFKINLLTMLTG